MLKKIINCPIRNKLLFIITIHISIFCQVPNFETTLPIIIIDTNGQNIVDEPKINADMGIIYNGWNETNKPTDPYNNYDGRIGIEIRGNTSQTYPKKSYAVETRTQTGENNNVSLLGMPSENDWVLYGPYSDKTLIRNAIAYKLSRMLGHYAPRIKFCELIINNDYKGLYLLIEKIKCDDNRVNISNLKDTDISGVELTGGYIFKIDSRTGSEIDGWSSPYSRDLEPGAGLFYQYHDPNKSDLMPEQELYIKNYVTNFENIMNTNYKYDATLGYYTILDMDDAVDYFIVNEACKNYDFGFASFFLYKNKDSNSNKLHFGPVWDFNISMGNSTGEEFASPQGWIADLTHNPWGTPLGRPFWFKFIWQDTKFLDLFNYKLRSVRSNYLSFSYINSTINNMVNEISEAVDRNFTRWPILNTKIDLTALGTYEAEVDYLKEWWSDHLQWIDSVVGSPISSDTTKPAIPTNFSASSQQGYIELSWSPNSEDDIWSYSIFKGTVDGGGFMNLLKIVLHPNTSYIDSLIDANTTYSYQISAMDTKNNQSDRSQQITTTTLGALENKNIPFFSIAQNTPNPFNSYTSITYTVPNESHVSITIYDLVGNEIISLHREMEHAGSHTLIWDGKDSLNNEAESGIYFYTIKVGENTKTKKMVLLK